MNTAPQPRPLSGVQPLPLGGSSPPHSPWWPSGTTRQTTVQGRAFCPLLHDGPSSHAEWQLIRDISSLLALIRTVLSHHKVRWLWATVFKVTCWIKKYGRRGYRTLKFSYSISVTVQFFSLTMQHTAWMDPSASCLKVSFTALLDSVYVTFACTPKSPGTELLSDDLGTEGAPSVRRVNLNFCIFKMFCSEHTLLRQLKKWRQAQAGRASVRAPFPSRLPLCWARAHPQRRRPVHVRPVAVLGHTPQPLTCSSLLW